MHDFVAAHAFALAVLAALAVSAVVVAMGKPALPADTIEAISSINQSINQWISHQPMDLISINQYTDWIPYQQINQSIWYPSFEKTFDLRFGPLSAYAACHQLLGAEKKLDIIR